MLLLLRKQLLNNINTDKCKLVMAMVVSFIDFKILERMLNKQENRKLKLSLLNYLDNSKRMQMIAH